MKISKNWLSHYLTHDLSDNQLNRALTFSGIEVEATQVMPRLPEELISAKVVTASAIEGSDHLKVCQVDANDPAGLLQVVCGAANCRSGMMVVLARIGAVLGDLTIKKAKLRGVESFGMLCSEREIGLSEEHGGIIELPADTPIGVSANELFGLPDTVFELEITPNRSDLLGYIGIARDLSANLGLPLKLPEIKEITEFAKETLPLKLRIDEPELCPRYTARLFSDVVIKASPLWLQVDLIKSGLRPISNVVDITNFVMLEQGHPLHAFDYDKLQKENAGDEGPAVIVRKAKPLESFHALNKKDYQLRDIDLVIADGQNPSALAGVMGSSDSAISSGTTRIVLESAAFNPSSIRRTSYHHKISSDSSYRFERHLSPECTIVTSLRATEMLIKYAQAKVASELMDPYPLVDRVKYLALRPANFERLIGYPMDTQQIKSYLTRLGCKFIKEGAWQKDALEDAAQIPAVTADKPAALWFKVPQNRVDLVREADLIEELARLDGYDKIPMKTPPSRIMDHHANRIQEIVSRHFVSQGFFEVLNYSFNDPASLQDLGMDPEINTQKLINPQSSNQSIMRVSLLPGLLENIRYNLNHYERDLKLFELARIYPEDHETEPLRCTALLTGNKGETHWKYKTNALDFSIVKGIMESLVELLDLQVDKVAEYRAPWLMQANSLAWYVKDEPVLLMGLMDAEVCEKFGIDLGTLDQQLWMIDIDLHRLIELTRNVELTYRDLPRFPAVYRDLSFLVPESEKWLAISEYVKSVEPELISGVQLLDQYRGKQVPQGFRSLHIRFKLQDEEKTLTEERIEQIVASVIEVLTKQCNIQMR
ncbi:MAG TPA: phenylalanine--tRNA ligase subunit beta [Candidatus Cloacimonadota bacterium]|mgnify:CR=1 FL=1|nr:phenylalanine--tRNA ligase subunit beta [Candidatus Cloacimonadota bacterium]